MKTYRDIVNHAFSELGLGPYTYARQPEDDAEALSRLTAILNEWTSSGAGTGFTIGDLQDDIAIPPDAVRGLACALAVDIAPGYGKQPSPTTVTNAHRGKMLMQRKNAQVPTKAGNWETIPAGAGWKAPAQRAVNFVEADTEVLDHEVSK